MMQRPFDMELTMDKMKNLPCASDVIDSYKKCKSQNYRLFEPIPGML